MENSSIFWNKITGWPESLGLPYISQTAAVLILLAVLLVLFFLLWLVMRKARLWYWKTNAQIDTLKSIDLHLKNVEEKLSSDVIKVVELSDKLAQPQKNHTEPSIQELPRETVTDGKGLTVIGKSGRVYTEAELELQIRD
ncbi:MAG: hypothetical protein AAGU75_03070 [Bacillota bacterium]